MLRFFQAMERNIKAKEYLTKAYQIFESKLGADHPNSKVTQKLLLELTEEE